VPEPCCDNWDCPGCKPDNAEASKRGKRSKRKGRAWEQDVARQLRDVLQLRSACPDEHEHHDSAGAHFVLNDCAGRGLLVERSLQSRGGAGLPDVVVRDIDGAKIIAVECKHGKQPNLTRALEQAERDRSKTRWVAAVCKRDNSRPTVTMWLDEWLELLGEWQA